MFENYIRYLNFIDEKLTRFFNKQKPYIFCKKGCAKCCKHAQFPYSLMEINYLLSGSMTLPPEVQEIISNNIARTLEERKNFKGEKFRYDCPFLINDECSVYEYRGLVCRSFGLMTVGQDDKTQAPFCYELGLNYSNVLDIETSKISVEKFKKLGVKEEPTAFNVSYETLADEDLARGFGFKFGDIKPLIEWFINENK